jgi:hypothetical protein
VCGKLECYIASHGQEETTGGTIENTSMNIRDRMVIGYGERSVQVDRAISSLGNFGDRLTYIGTQNTLQDRVKRGFGDSERALIDE